MNKVLKVFIAVLLVVFVVVVAAGFVRTLNNKGASVGSMPINSFYNGTNGAVSVTTSNTAIVSSNVGRQYLVIVNDGANPVYLSLGGTAVANSGIRLNAQGGSIELTQDNLFTGAISGIAVGGTSVVTVFEK